MSNGKIILDLCGGTGAWSRPYKEAGYDVRLVTLPDNDVLTYEPPYGVYGILAAPPCESFSNQRRGQIVLNRSMDIDTGLSIMNACLRIIEQCNPVFWALENPATGEMKKYLGKPAMTFQPYEYGDGWSKSTTLWGKFNVPVKTHTWESCPKLNLYVRPGRTKPSIVAQHKSAIKDIPQFEPFSKFIKSDYDLRSTTPPGFAQAFFDANK